MKKLFLLLFLAGCFAFNAQAQLTKISANDLPDEVKTGLKAKYKSAKPTAYFTDENEDYVVTVPMAGKQWNATFKADGTWVSSETPIDAKMVPGMVTKKMKESEYKSWKVKKAYEFQNPKNKKLFKLNIVNKKETNNLYYDMKGLLIRDELVDGEGSSSNDEE